MARVSGVVVLESGGANLQTCKPIFGAVAIEIPGLWHHYCMVARKDPLYFHKHVMKHEVTVLRSLSS
ncbi:hypothetical protein CCP4SC76_2350003 [Gammaproteobacteria bacterium]